MKKKHQWANMVVAAILSTGVGIAENAVAADEQPMEKCYGVAKKGMNQCGTPLHSCQGAATKDNDPAEWIYVPVGTCKKMGGMVKKDE